MYRKISYYIEEYFTGNEGKILCIDDARQVGKSYIIRELAQRHFENYIEINMADDKVGEVDYLIDNYDELNVLPIEIKSGKDYKNFRALPKIILDSNYRMTKGYVFSNEREVKKEDRSKI